MQGGAVAALSAVNEIDFDWPRRFWNSLSEQDQQNLIRCAQNIVPLPTRYRSGSDIDSPAQQRRWAPRCSTHVQRAAAHGVAVLPCKRNARPGYR